MTEVRAEGIVIRKADLGEADRLLTVLTLGHGKLAVLAKGARRPNAKLAAWLDMFRCNEMTWVTGKTFPVVTGAATKQMLVSSDMGWDRLAVAYHICELVDKLVEEGEEMPGLYVLAKDSLAALSVKDLDESIVRASFEMKLMQLMGIAPELHKCVVSGQSLDADKEIRFSTRLGGVVQGGGDDFARTIAVDQLKLLRLFAKYPPAAIGKVRAESGCVQGAVECAGDFLAYSVEVRLKSLIVAGQVSGV